MRQKLLLVVLAALVLKCVPIDAQQFKKIPRVGFVALSTAAAGGQNFKAFRARLREVGYIEDRNIRLEPRWADGSAEQLPNLQELILNQWTS